MAHQQPISLYVATAENAKGRPHAVVDRDESGKPRLRLHPAGPGGPYMVTPLDDWAIINAVVAEAIADAAL